MSCLQVVHKISFVTIQPFRCQVKVSFICCQLTKRVRNVLTSTSRIHLSSMQLRNMSKGISLFSTPSFNQVFKDYVIDILTVSSSSAIKSLNLALRTKRCILAKEDHWSLDNFQTNQLKITRINTTKRFIRYS
jgi:hypothetical protein